MNNDLISRSALKEEFEREKELNPYHALFFDKVIAVIDNAPTVEAFTKDDMAGAYNEGYACGSRESERPKGEWIEGENGNIKCDQCKSEIRYSYLIGNEPDFPKFCCDCGANMKGGKK